MPNILKKFRNKLLLLNMVSLSIVIFVSFMAVYFVLASHMRDVDKTKLQTISQNTYSYEWSEELAIDIGRTFFINVSPSGEVSIYSHVKLGEKDYLEAMDRTTKNGRHSGKINLRGDDWIFNSHLTPDGSRVFVFLNVRETDEALLRLVLSMLLISLVVLAAFFVVSRVFANRAMRPASESFDRQRQFIADASHELKTPLAIIDANAEAALSELGEPQAAGSEENMPEVFIGRIESESGRMRELIDDMLFLARAEDGKATEDYELPTNLGAVAEEELGRIEAVLFEKGVGLEYRKHETEGPFVKTDPHRIRQTMLILLENAVKYTPGGGKVVVETGLSKKGPVRMGNFIVTNTGEGISKEDLPHIFDRFYRADKSRNSFGYGLGLSIARTIVERSGGNITCDSENGLTKFTIELPVA